MGLKSIPASWIADRWTMVRLLLVYVQVFKTIAGQTAPPIYPGYCSAHTFNATCAPDEVIVMIGANYGRMRLDSKCLQTNFGYIGCYSDVLDIMDTRCSGRRHCQVNIPDVDMDKTKPCMNDLRRYLEADYRCVQVKRVNPSVCTTSRDVIAIKQDRGTLSSDVTLETGCGTHFKPWEITVSPSKRINLTLYDFGVETIRKRLGSSTRMKSLCREYAVIKEVGTDKMTKICGGETRVKNIYLSESNSVRIGLMGISKPYPLRFVINYEAVGCPQLKHSRNSWVEYHSGYATVGCNGSSTTWRVDCKDDKWVGTIGNCSTEAQTRALEDAFQGFMSSLPNAFVIVIIIAIAVLISLCILVIGLIYLKRRRPSSSGIRKQSVAGRRLSTSSKDVHYSKCDTGTYSTTRRQHYNVPIATSDNSYGQYPYHQRVIGSPSAPAYIGPPPYAGPYNDEQVEHIYESPVFERKRTIDCPQYYEMADDVNHLARQGLNNMLNDTGKDYRSLNTRRENVLN